jgi:archaellum component FlaC
MTNTIDIIKKEVGFRFNLIEKKLIISFQSIKKDKELVSTEISKIKKEILDLGNLKEEVSSLKTIFSDRLDKISNELESTKKLISKKDLRKDVLMELKSDLVDLSKKQKQEINDFQKKERKSLEKDFMKYSKKSDDLKNEFIMFKHEFVSLRDDWEDARENLGRELKELLKQTEEGLQGSLEDLRNQITALKARNTILTKELNSLKGNGYKELIKEIKGKNNKTKKKGIFGFMSANNSN